VGKTQVHTILKDSEDIYKWWQGGNASHIKKKLKPYSFQIDEVVYEWFCATRYKNAPISGPLIQEKALEVVRALNFGGFKTSNGWLYRFKTCHNILCKTICGEPADAPKETADLWKEKLYRLCDGYLERDIFNCNETGLTFRAPPDKTLKLKNNKCFGHKISKQRLMVLLCSNMLGDFEKPLIRGNAKNPRCFKGVQLENLNLTWQANKNA
jgi:hypothetical protein